MDASLATSQRPRTARQDDDVRELALATLHAAAASAIAVASRATLAAIIGAAGDPVQAFAVAPRDLAPAPAERLVAERAAKARTVEFRAEMAAKAGGMIARADMAQVLGVSPAAVDKQRQRGQILGVPYGNEIRYPAAQLRQGAPAPGLKAVLAALSDMNPWGKLQLLVAPIDGFSDEPASILDLLARGVDAETLDELAGLARGWAA